MLGLADSAVLARPDAQPRARRARRVPHEHPRAARRARPTRSTPTTSITRSPSARWCRRDLPRRAPDGVPLRLAGDVELRRALRAPAQRAGSGVPRRRWCGSSPQPHDYRERIDFFGNRAAYFAVLEPHTQLTVTAESVVDVTASGFAAPPGRPSVGNGARPSAPSIPPTMRSTRAGFCCRSPKVVVTPDVADYAAESSPPAARSPKRSSRSPRVSTKTSRITRLDVRPHDADRAARTPQGRVPGLRPSSRSAVCDLSASPPVT